MGRLRRAAESIEEVLGVALLAAMLGLAFVNIVTRYCLHYSLAFTEEVEVAGLVWLTLLGAAAGVKRGAHLGFTFLSRHFPRLVRRVLLLFSALLALAAFGALFWFSALQIRDERELQITSEALGSPQWIYTIAIPVGVLLVVLRLIQATVRSLREETEPC